MRVTNDRSVGRTGGGYTLRELSLNSQMMRLTVFLFLAFAVSLAVNPAAEQVLTDASDLVDIRGKDAKPFQLELDFHAQNKVLQDGHLTLKWAAKDLWWQQVTMGEFRQVQVRKGDILSIRGNMPFTPVRISELGDLLRVLSAEAKDWEVKKISHTAEAGADIDCLKVRARQRHAWPREKEVCINRSSKEVLSDDVRNDDNRRRKEFADYQVFLAHRYPSKLTLRVDGSWVLVAKVVSLREASFDDALFVAPPGAIARRQCENMVHPVAIKQPDPAYPRSAAQNKMGGTVMVTLEVLADGSVGEVHLIESSGHEMDQVTQDTVKTWKFKPAMCGNEPVVADIQVDVTFHPLAGPN